MDERPPKKVVPDWNRVASLLVQGIESPEAYLAAVARNEPGAAAFVEAAIAHDPVPTPALWQHAHALLFRGVYLSAGQLRPEGREVAVGPGAWETAHSSRVPRELLRLQGAMVTLLDAARSEIDRARAVTFAHECFERVHPFLDGNGRVGRLILDAQVKHLLGRDIGPPDRDLYLEGMERAHRTGDLRPLTWATTEILLPPERARVTEVPHALWPALIPKRLADGKTIEISCADLESAVALRAARLTPALVSEIARRGGHTEGLAFTLHRGREQDDLVLDVARTQTRDPAKKKKDFEPEM